MRIVVAVLLASLCSACAQSHEQPWLTGDPMSGDDSGNGGDDSGTGSMDASIDVGTDTSMDSSTGGSDVGDPPDVGPMDATPDTPADSAPDTPADTAPDTMPDVPPPVDACADNIPVACDGVDDDCDGDSDEGMCGPPPGTGTGLFFEPDDYVVLSGSGLDLGTGEFTVEVWYTPSATSANGTVFGNRPSAPSPGVICTIGRDGTMVEPFMTLDTLTVGLPNEPGGTLIYSALARGSDGSIGIAAEGVATGTGRVRPDSVTNGAWQIGQSGVGDPGFTGVVSRIRIWSVGRPLASLVATSADATDTAGLVAEFNFSEGAGQTITSRVGDVTGRLGSTTGEDANDPMWVE